MNTNTQSATSKIFYFDIGKFLARKNVKRTLLKSSFAFIVIGLVIGGIGLANHAYADRIYPKITIAGVDVGGLSRPEAKLKIDEKIKILNENGPEITYNDQTINPKLDEMGITFNSEETLDQAFNYGRGGSLKQNLLNTFKLARSGTRVELKPQIDEAKFDEYISQLASTVEKEAQDAKLTISGGVISVSPSEKGRGLDKNKLKSDLTALINSGTPSGKISMETSDFDPAVVESDTIDAQAQAEAFMKAAPISVTFENSEWVAGRSEIGSWISFSPVKPDDKLVATISPNSFVNYIAKQVEIPMADREVEDGTGNVISEGQDGRGVDTNTLTAQISAALHSGQSGSFALITFAIPRGQKTIYPHSQPGRYPGKYIDINLSEQTLYAYEGSNLVNQFLISSGVRGHGTPTGEFSVYGKDRAALMDGEDYSLPNVPYISWFSGDYSIHGTYWHHNFGTPMSHGCVNASTPDAEWIFNWDDIGTPVYIHY